MKKGVEAQSKYLNKSSGDKKLGEGPKRTPFHILMCYSYPFDSILTFFEIYIMKTILKRLDLKFNNMFRKSRKGEIIQNQFRFSKKYHPHPMK